MAFHRLAWRVGTPFVLLVLVETIGLAVYLRADLAAENRATLEQLAATNAALIEQKALPTEEPLARDLERATGCDVYFRTSGILRAARGGDALVAAGSLTALPADGRAQRIGEFDCVAVPVLGKADLVLRRRAGDEFAHPRTLAVLLAFWLLAGLTAWMIVRGLVRPLRNLSAQLPGIEDRGELRLPEAHRTDEIGDLARSFLDTRSALHEERETRERIEKLAVLGRMTAALAHEIQNPVAAIRMHAQLWHHGAGDETAEVVEQEAARIESLLNQWLFLTRPEPPTLRPIDLADLLARTLRVHRARLLHAQVDVALDAADALVVAGDGKRLAQVFDNLLTNAVQAMPRGGSLRMAAAAEGGVATVTFDDTGRGFSPAALDRFAEYFFSEKEGGMGIGLSVATEIVKAHGGTLRVANRPEGGARITVVLPRVERSRAGQPTDAPPGSQTSDGSPPVAAA
jgi:signal transduction histidine kinase